MPRRKSYRPRRRTTRRKRMPRRRRKTVSKRTIMRIPRPIKPVKSAFCTHKKIMYFRIPGNIPQQPTTGVSFPMSGFGSDGYTGGLAPYPHLLISCNDPMAPVNQMRTPQNFPGSLATPISNTPAFFSRLASPDVTEGLWDSTGANQLELPAGTARVDDSYKNRYPSRWLKMTQFFRKYTVVGSKVKLTFQPAPFLGQAPGYGRQLQNPCIFVFGKRAGRNPRIEDYPQALEESPTYKSIQWFGLSTDRGKYNAIQFRHKWSAKKDMSLGKGEIVAREDITGFSSANPCRCLVGSDAYVGSNLNTNPTSATQGEGLIPPDPSQHPRRQMYYHFAGVSGLTDGDIVGPYQPSLWPAGIIKIEVDYATVWSQYRHLDNETTAPALAWATPPVDYTNPPTP